MYLVSVAAYGAPVRYCNRYPGLDHPSLRKNGATRGARSAPGLDSFALSGVGVSKRQALFFWRAFLGAIVSQGLTTPASQKPGFHPSTRKTRGWDPGACRGPRSAPELSSFALSGAGVEASGGTLLPFRCGAHVLRLDFAGPILRRELLSVKV